MKYDPYKKGVAQLVGYPPRDQSLDMPLFPLRRRCVGFLFSLVWGLLDSNPIDWITNETKKYNPDLD